MQKQQEICGRLMGFLDFPSGTMVKNLPANTGDAGNSGSVPGLGRSPGGRHGNPLQYSCLENPMGKGAWQAAVHGEWLQTAESQAWLKRYSMHHTQLNYNPEHWKESSRKTSTFALLTMPKPLTVWITTNCRKFLKRWKYQTILPASWKICMQVRKQQLELDMEQQTGSK